ncbi:hypothetical protein [Mycolicibacterium cosmeticum]|uniref:hypothetical protein n=1 Tax=Mycolicibacterium cosmeticum TaxID=258533 RepID=UPI003204D0A3
MRMAVLVMASALVAGCSQDMKGAAVSAPPPLTAVTPGSSRPAPTSPPAPSSAVPHAPSAGAPIAEVTRWVDAGTAVPAAKFGSTTRDGASTDVQGVAFTTETVSCISSAQYNDGALACLVKLTNPPPKPPDTYTMWKGNWVDFDGTGVNIGSLHGDPGPFGNGSGPQLGAGETVKFGDFACRADGDAVVCVNYAHRTAARMRPAGVDGFGCLAPAQAPPDIGIRLSC